MRLFLITLVNYPYGHHCDWINDIDSEKTNRNQKSKSEIWLIMIARISAARKLMSQMHFCSQHTVHNIILIHICKIKVSTLEFFDECSY